MFTDWQSLLIESGGYYWLDDAKKISIDCILSDDLVRAMITVPSQPDFGSHCSVFKETDDRLRAYKARSIKRCDSGVIRFTRKRLTDATQAILDNKEFNGREVTRKASVECRNGNRHPQRSQQQIAQPQSSSKGIEKILTSYDDFGLQRVEKPFSIPSRKSGFLLYIRHRTGYNVKMITKGQRAFLLQKP